MTTAEHRLDRPLLVSGGVLMTGAMLALLSTTIITVGTDTLALTFQAPISTVQWVSAGYLLAMAASIPLVGWAVDRFGGRPMWITAMVVYLAGSLLAAGAWSAASLIGFRVLQGLGAGMLEPIVLIMLARAAGPGRVARVLGVMQIPLMLAPIAGPAVGGLLLDQLSWRWLLLAGVPIGLAALVLARRLVPADPPTGPGRTHFDVLGAALAPPGLAAVMFALTQAGHGAALTDSQLLLPLALGAALLAGYVVHALRTRIIPLIDLRLFAIRGFPAMAGTALLFGASVYGAMFLLPLYYQQARGLSALHSGLLLAAQGVGAALVLPFIGRLADRYGARNVVTTGLALTVAGTVAYTQLGQHSDQLWLSLWLLVRGIGLGATLAPTLAVAHHLLGPARAAQATSVLVTALQLGGALGTALLAVVLQQQTTALAAGEPVAAAFAATSWFALAICVLAMITAWFLPGKPVGPQVVVPQGKDH